MLLSSCRSRYGVGRRALSPPPAASAPRRIDWARPAARHDPKEGGATRHYIKGADRTRKWLGPHRSFATATRERWGENQEEKNLRGADGVTSEGKVLRPGFHCITAKDPSIGKQSADLRESTRIQTLNKKKKMSQWQKGTLILYSCRRRINYECIVIAFANGVLVSSETQRCPRRTRGNVSPSVCWFSCLLGWCYASFFVLQMKHNLYYFDRRNEDVITDGFPSLVQWFMGVCGLDLLFVYHLGIVVPCNLFVALFKRWMIETRMYLFTCTELPWHCVRAVLRITASCNGWFIPHLPPPICPPSLPPSNLSLSLTWLLRFIFIFFTV